jgi:hypothetical protein
MKKIKIIIIGIFIVMVLINGCIENNYKQNNNNEQTSYTIIIKLNNNSSSYFLQAFYKIYEDVENWQSSEIIDKSSLIFENGVSDSYSLNMSSGKSYVIDIWLVCECTNCPPCYVPESKLNKHFFGTFSSDETFSILSTGYIIKSDGTLLSNL